MPRRRRRAGVFPELTLSGYSIEDILLQDALLDAVEVALGTIVAGSADLLPVLVVGAPLRHRHRVYNTRRRHPPRAGARRRAEVVPADVPRVLRAPPARRRRRRARHDPRRSATTCRSGRTCCSPPTTSPGLVAARRGVRGHVGADPAERRGRARRGHRAGQPVAAARSPSGAPRTAPCCAARRRRAAWPPTSTPRPGEGESSTDLAWDGQTMIHENGVLLAESRALPRRRRAAASPTSTSSCCAPSGSGWARSTTTAARTRRATARSAPRRLHARPADAGDLGLRRTRRALPVRARRRAPARPGLLRGVQHPGRRAGAAAARARRPEGGHRRLRRPRLDARADRRRPGDGPRWTGRAATSSPSPCRASPPASAPGATPNGWHAPSA